MKKVTILDTVEKVLREADGPKTLEEIYGAIVAGGLYEFKARDALGVVRATIRKHLWKSASSPAGGARVVDCGQGRFGARPAGT